MKNYRVFGLALSLMCLLAAPRMFAKSSDHDKDKHSSKESTPQPKSHSGSAHSSSGSGESHGSSGQSHNSHGSSSSGEVKSEHKHESGDVRAEGAAGGTGDSKSEHTTHGSSNGDSSRNHGTHSASSTDSSHVHGTHDSSSTTYSHSHGSSSTTITHSSSHDHGSYHAVDHAHLHDVMHAHSGPQERAHAFERNHLERERFQRHASAIHFLPAHRVVLGRVRIVPTTYYYRRSVFYDTYAWTPPAYVYRMYPRYGLWDAAFLAFALDHIAEEQYAMMIYNHRNEAEIQQWMDDNDRLAADNDELREKLENMKLQMSKMQEQGVTVDSSYVPPDAEDVALAPEVITALTASKD
jgi:hypothetical protein